MGKYIYGLETLKAAFNLIQADFIIDSTYVLPSTFSKGNTPLILYIGSFCV